MLVIGTEKEINEKIKSLSNEKLLKNEYGKPYYENINIRFNKSNTLDLSVLIIDNKECGIDIERIRKYDEVMAKRILSREEYDFVNRNNKDFTFTLIWTLKESYLKCIGTGLNLNLKDISFVKDNKILKTKNNYKLNYLIYEDKYIISYCTK